MIVLSISVLVVVGCDRDRGFRTQAVYRAPLNKLEITIDASGVVLAGHDVCEDGIGRVQVTSLDESAPASIQGFDGRWINSLQFSGDGRLLVASGLATGGEVRVWETADWKLLHSVHSPERLLQLRDVPVVTYSRARERTLLSKAKAR